MESTILLSIHPEHVKKILNGEKKYEFRKVKTKNKINKIFIYSTAPISKIIAYADVDEIVEGNPEYVWSKTNKESGINKSFFLQYYNKKNKAIAYKLSNIKIFEKAKELRDFGIKSAPQSFMYLKDINLF